MRTIRLTATILTTLFLAAGGLALADGTEFLAPTTATLEPGTGIVAGGIGLGPGQPRDINVNVPGTVKQALIYWMGASNAPGAGFDDVIEVNTVPVLGTVAGGPNEITEATPVGYTWTFRADITTMVASGPNTLSIGGLNFDRALDGAGVIVVYDDGGSPGAIDIRDGNDFAADFTPFTGTFTETVPQTFSFTAAATDRVGTLVIFTGDTQSMRSDIVRITSGGIVDDLVDVLGMADDLFDALTLAVNIPAGATTLTVEVISGDFGATGFKPESLVWGAAALAVPGEEQDGEGCTPGYWKNHPAAWPPTGLAPGDDFDSTFGVDWYDPNIDLDTALDTKGGGRGKCTRHGTAALLNALHPDVNYPLTAAEVIAGVQAEDCDAMADFNELCDTCPTEGECDDQYDDGMGGEL